jgi:hypothetical protein
VGQEQCPWQECLPRPVELGEEPPTIAFGAHHDRGTLQFVDRILPCSNLAKADAVLPCRVLKFCQAKFHANHDWRQRFAETNGLLSRLPVEVCLGTRRILNNQILRPFLQSLCPREDTLNTCRVWRDNAHGSEPRAGSRDILIHRVEPVARYLPGTGSHVSKDDRRAGFEMIYEPVESGWRVNIHLGY